MKPSKIPYILAFFILFSLSLSTAAAARDTVTPARPLADNETLVSSDGSFALGFFSPSATTTSRYVGIWYNKIPSRDIVWVANRANPVIDSPGQLSVTANGTLVITDQSSNVVWSAAGGRTGPINPVAQLLDTGNFVVKGDGSENATYAWQGFDYPTDTLLPGMKLGVDRTTGLNRTLWAWKSKTDPSPGYLYAAVDIRGDPEVYLWAGSTKQWRSGPSVGIGLSSIPADRGGFSVRFVNDDREATYSQAVTDGGSIVSRVVVNQSAGAIQHSLWSWEAGRWNVSWSAPSGKCDAVGACGAYGVCDDGDDSPALCQCLQGFVPRNQREWDLRSWGEGCVRSTNLSCANGTAADGFVVVGGVKLPVSANAVVDTSLGPEECGAACLKNCSCTAYASANVTAADGKKGCVMWVGELLDVSKLSTAGQNLYLRLSAVDLAPRKGKSLWSRVSWPLFVTTCDLLLVLLTIYLTCVFRRLWKRRRSRRATPYAINFFNQQFDEGCAGNDFDLPILDFATVEAATGYFSTANKLGAGGYGPVYKGMLSDGQEIAVKRLSKTSLQGTEEFKNEVILIAKLQNRNLVRLLGCCIEGEERLLIYEYMINKSLDAFLFERKVPALDWQTRYRIILGITRGLLYLHHDSRLRIIHRDMKASNILLDKDMNPKISDFGMARILGGDETDINTKKVVGTYGYMSPEYALDGNFSLKSDVYSFGVLVLEIISGKKNRGSSPFSPQLNLVSLAWSLWIERKGLELVDESMNYTVAVNEVLNCIKVGLLCVQERPEDRPLMSSVILMLGSDIATLPEPKQPGFVTRVLPLEIDESVNMREVYASNRLSTSLVGR